MIPELDIGRSALLTDIAMCVNYYRLFSPGLFCCMHAAVQLDEETRLHPGLLVMANYGRHKQCETGPDYDYFRGGPNFVLDVFDSPDDADFQRHQAASRISFSASFGSSRPS